MYACVYFCVQYNIFQMLCEHSVGCVSKAETGRVITKRKPIFSPYTKNYFCGLVYTHTSCIYSWQSWQSVLYCNGIVMFSFFKRSCKMYLSLYFLINELLIHLSSFEIMIAACLTELRPHLIFVIIYCVIINLIQSNKMKLLCIKW